MGEGVERGCTTYSVVKDVFVLRRPQSRPELAAARPIHPAVQTAQSVGYDAISLVRQLDSIIDSPRRATMGRSGC